MAVDLAGFAVARDPAESGWTGSNGKSFRGTFRQLTADGGKAGFLTTDGEGLAVAINTLFPEVRKRAVNTRIARLGGRVEFAPCG